jgi:hypothetical protein
MGKGKCKGLARIFVVDILLCSAFPIIGRTSILHNRTVGIRNLPNLFGDNPGKATDEIVDVHFFLSFSLGYVSIISSSIGKSTKKNEDFYRSILLEASI